MEMRTAGRLMFATLLIQNAEHWIFESDNLSHTTPSTSAKLSPVNHVISCTMNKSTFYKSGGLSCANR
jgi:hypothetical protein